MKFSYEDVNVVNKDEMESKCTKQAKAFLGNRIDALEEVIITANIENTLKERMIPSEFEERKIQKEFAYYMTDGITLRTKKDLSTFCIVLSNSNNIVSNFSPIFCHELTHVYWYLILDKYLKDFELSEEDSKKVEYLIHFVSEYDACLNQRKSAIIFSEEDYFNIEEEAKRILKAYKSLYNEDRNKFNYGVEYAVAEFRNISIRQMGYRDAVQDDKLYDSEISKGLVFGLFGDTMGDFSRTIRDFTQGGEMNFKEITESLIDIEEKQFEQFNANIGKYI